MSSAAEHARRRYRQFVDHGLAGSTNPAEYRFGFGLMLLGIVFGVIGVNVTFHLTAFVGAAETEYGHWITRYGLQYGFLMLAVAYIFYRGIEIGVLNTEVGFTGLY